MEIPEIENSFRKTVLVSYRTIGLGNDAEHEQESDMVTGQFTGCSDNQGRTMRFEFQSFESEEMLYLFADEIIRISEEIPEERRVGQGGTLDITPNWTNLFRIGMQQMKSAVVEIESDPAALRAFRPFLGGLAIATMTMSIAAADADNATNFLLLRQELEVMLGRVARADDANLDLEE